MHLVEVLVSHLMAGNAALWSVHQVSLKLYNSLEFNFHIDVKTIMIYFKYLQNVKQNNPCLKNIV